MRILVLGGAGYIGSHTVYELIDAGYEVVMAKLYSEDSGITMTVYSDLCGMQLYTGNFLDGVVGKGGTRYEEKAGICFETQYYPNACNVDRFPSSILKAGKTYKSRTIYQFANLKT